jgi:hypothetical protein
MNKKLIFFLFLILEQYLAHSQILKGIIKDRDDSITIPYVNVSFSSKEIGTSSNTSGRFILNLDKIKEDRLYVSSIGYTPKYINIPNQNKSDTIYITILLKKLTHQLESVTITPQKKIKIYKLGTRHSKYSNGTFAVGLGNQITTYIKNTHHKGGLLKKIHVKFEHEKSLPLADIRIRIYAYDSKLKQPGKDLLTKNIILSTKRKSKIDIDVCSHGIHMPKNGICIGIEWLSSTIKKQIKTPVSPALRFYFNKNEERHSWLSYRGKDHRIINFTSKNGIGNPVIDISFLSNE